MNELQYLTSVCAFTPFGPKRIKLMLSYFKKARSIWFCKESTLMDIGLSKALTEKFIEFRKHFDILSYHKKLNEFGIHVVSINHKNYPKNLKHLDDAPQVLYVRGDLEKTDSNAVAIVGTRLMTSYGREVANKFAKELSGFGITIISGLALGVDAEAQRSAFTSGGRTIGVLASGLDIISPATNKNLAMGFIKKNGALVSEKPLGYKPFAADFPVRDRLISGLAKAVIVVEGRMKSGTFHTVKAALEQGRCVFAVPGPITSVASEGPNYLIQNGAKLVTNTREIMEELDIQFKVDNQMVQSIIPDGPIEEKLAEILLNGESHLDELVRISGVAIHQVSARLTIMEMKGLVKNLGGGIYRKI